MRHLRLAPLLALALAALAAQAPAASTEIGSTGPANLCVPTTFVQHQTAAVSPSYVVPTGGGVITSWRTQGGSDDRKVKLKVLRHRPEISPTTYEIVAESGEQTNAANTLNTFPAQIPVAEGDRLGLKNVTSNWCAIDTPNAQDVARRNTASADTPPGTTTNFSGAISTSLLNISATVESDADKDGLGDDTQDPDLDNDGVADISDNCLGVTNPDQADYNKNGQGNACDPTKPGRCTNSFLGTTDNDTIVGGALGDAIYGQAGNDRLRGEAGADCLFGRAGKDSLSGGDGNDQLSGEEGNDTLSGGDGGDRLSGGSGIDVLKGGKGKNQYKGGPGRDKISARNGRRDKVDCGTGTDRATVDANDAVQGNCEIILLP